MKNLYLVTTTKFSVYVIAEDPTEAYIKLRAKLDEWDYGFSNDRELKEISVLANEISWGLEDAFSSIRKVIL